MTEPSTESSSYISDTTQTRFSFYNASDYSVEVSVTTDEPVSSNDDSCCVDKPPEPQRFTFYAAPALETPRTDNLEVATAGAANNNYHAEVAPSRSDPDASVDGEEEADMAAAETLSVEDDTERGLESQRQSPVRLESTRNQQQHTRRLPNSPNPYEDAIREALELLRKHRTTTSPSRETTESLTNSLMREEEPMTPANRDTILQSRRTPLSTQSSRRASPASEFSRTSRLTDAYQAEIETRRQQRQERMAKYANRLAELKQQDVQETDSEADHHGVPQPTASDEASVQAGVERVLLAILERAGSRGRQTQGVESRHESQEHVQSHPSWARGEEKKSVEDENALLQAMSELLGTSSTMSNSQPDTGRYDPVAASRSMDSVEPNESHDVHDDDSVVAPPPRLTRTTITHLDTSNEAVEAVASIETPRSQQDLQHVPTAQSQDHDELDELVRQFSSATSTSASQRHVIKHPIEERVRQILSSDSSKDKRGATDRIPDRMMKTCAEVERARFPHNELSSGDERSAGVSYNEDEESDLDSSFGIDNDHRDNSVDRVLGPLAKSNTTTGVVLEPDSPEPSGGVFETISAVMSLVTGDAPVSPTSSEVTKDRYADVDDNSSDSDDSSDDDSSSSEANDLMRSLCAHLLPVGVDQTCRVLDALPEWDNANPDEPGYRIVRLRGAQLRRVEMEFEAMVEKLKRHSQRDLSKLAEGSLPDAMFERDLKTAEDLLENDEKRLNNVHGSVPTDPAIHQAIITTPNGNGDVDTSIDHDPPLAKFPGIKDAGKGEMGDLEFFHLPVIFKSHVTGFEPTKDMYLEAGNIIAGQYLVEGELGSAAFSTAYRCIDLSSEGDGPDGHEEVCLKVIKNTKDFFDQSLDEIKILELLRQTGMCHEKAIVEMKTFFYYREHLIIVTELLRQNLFEFGKFIVEHNEEPYFTLPRLAYITRQCLEALEFVHELTLVHSDVKPGTI